MQEFYAKESSNIGWARYFPEEMRLEIDFKTMVTGARTSTYEYRNFSPMDWDDFLAAESKGKHVAYKIRNAKDASGNVKFPATKVQR